MKKIILFFLVILMTACNIKIEDDINNIKINDININENDYIKLVDNLNKLNYTKIKINEEYENNILVTTDDGIIEYNISEEVIEMKKDGNIYYSENKFTIKIINDEIEYILNNYNKKDFFNINLSDEYIKNETDIYHEIDAVEQYFVITINTNLKEFFINKTEILDGEYLDIEPLFQIENIEKNIDIIVRVNITKDYFTYKFTLVNEYGKKVEIIPYYDNEKENNELKFKVNYLEW